MAEEVVSIQYPRVIEDGSVNKRKGESGVAPRRRKGRRAEDPFAWKNENHDLEPKPWGREPSKVSQGRVSRFGDLDQCLCLDP